MLKIRLKVVVRYSLPHAVVLNLAQPHGFEKGVTFFLIRILAGGKCWWQLNRPGI